MNGTVPFLGKYRSKLEIFRDILLAVSVKEGAKKTRILYSANLGGKVFNRRLEEILRVGLLECDEEPRYWLTDKGERFLKLFKDYDGSRRDLKKQITDLEKQKKALKEILSSQGDTV